MELVNLGGEQIILVPDTNNNRIQVFKKDKSDLIFMVNLEIYHTLHIGLYL